MEFTDRTDALLAAARSFAPADGGVSPDALAAALAPFLRRAFAITAPDAPGLHFVGAQLAVPGLPPLAVGGTGLDESEAIASCLGEAFERLSQVDDGTIVRHGGPLPADLPDGLAAWLRARAPDPALLERAQDWLAVRALPAGDASVLPADLCLRRPAARQVFVPDLPLSSGCAAGPSRAAAEQSALCELVERDAAALWWHGGAPAAALAAADQAVANETTAALRQRASGRRTWLLDITSDLGLPCVAALSCAPSGRGLAVGLAARPRRAAAIRAALLELGQMELALRLTRAKAAAEGEEGLNATEQGQIARARAIDVRACRILHPRRRPMSDESSYPVESGGFLEAARQRGAIVNPALYALDLTRPAFGVAVVRLFAPGLAFPGARAPGERLTAAIRKNGRSSVGKLPLL